ncbi:hypothetical protein TNCV_180061 [Trichonephila clavipes]|nr:hypothetical protein TNCV_180061 [Trichonephila clavipes]
MVRFWLDSTPISNTLEVVRGLSPLPPISREDLRLDGYLEYPHAAKLPNRWRYSISTSPSPNQLPSCQQGRQKMMSAWLYRQHFAVFPLNRHYNAMEEYAHVLRRLNANGLVLQPVLSIFSGRRTKRRQACGESGSFPLGHCVS